MFRCIAKLQWEEALIHCDKAIDATTCILTLQGLKVERNEILIHLPKRKNNPFGFIWFFRRKSSKN